MVSLSFSKFIDDVFFPKDSRCLPAYFFSCLDVKLSDCTFTMKFPSRVRIGVIVEFFPFSSAEFSSGKSCLSDRFTTSRIFSSLAVIFWDLQFFKIL